MHDMFHRLMRVIYSTVLLTNKLRFHLFFKHKPSAGQFCNSRLISIIKTPSRDTQNRPYLVIIRCGAGHRLIDDAIQRTFDIALNLYGIPHATSFDDCEYVFSGGINKYKAARQFINEELLEKYQGFMFLDDDIEITYSHLSQFLTYCSAHGFELAQPSLTLDSSFSHAYLLNASTSGCRSVRMVEVMCPYFSSSALRIAKGTFDLSYSTWGLDVIWPQLFASSPVVVDEFKVRHTKPVGTGNFYKYMRSIGVSPQRELIKLTNTSTVQIRDLRKPVE